MATEREAPTMNTVGNTRAARRRCGGDEEGVLRIH
jgi:hypothetical protein